LGVPLRTQELKLSQVPKIVWCNRIFIVRKIRCKIRQMGQQYARYVLTIPGCNKGQSVRHIPVITLFRIPVFDRHAIFMCTNERCPKKHKYVIEGFMQNWMFICQIAIVSTPCFCKLILKRTKLLETLWPKMDILLNTQCMLQSIGI